MKLKRTIDSLAWFDCSRFVVVACRMRAASVTRCAMIMIMIMVTTLTVRCRTAHDKPNEMKNWLCTVTVTVTRSFTSGSLLVVTVAIKVWLTEREVESSSLSGALEDRHDHRIRSCPARVVMHVAVWLD
jgi:hypothetical protein